MFFKHSDRTMKLLSLLVVIATITTTAGFNHVANTVGKTMTTNRHLSTVFSKSKMNENRPSNIIAHASSSTVSALSEQPDNSSKGGIFSFKTKYGMLNPFAIYYGVTSILLGLPWFVALTSCQLFYAVTREKIDKMRYLPTLFSRIWGILLLRLTYSYPVVVNRDRMHEFFKQKRAAMIVGNHNSWMDIPFLGTMIGWQNYKFISKAELAKVPILGKSIKCGGHIMVDRSSRRSQIMTLKNGIQLLKDGVHLVTFPEGTRSKTGRLLPFKNGAFKMAHKNGSPVIPVSIIRAGVVHPPNWMFPRRYSRGTCKVIIHDPIESNDKTEQELADAVREAIISGLPDEQKPLNS